MCDASTAAIADDDRQLRASSGVEHGPFCMETVRLGVQLSRHVGLAW
jgi:hypothetical protein